MARPSLLAITLTAMVFLVSPAFTQEKDDPAAALDGEWELVEMIYRTRVQDFGDAYREKIRFHKGQFWQAFLPDDENLFRFGGDPYVVRPGEIDIDRGGDGIIKARYEIKDGKLWFAWREDDAGRPQGFGAVADKNLTLRVFKKIEK